jgi:hypothetical protein
LKSERSDVEFPIWRKKVDSSIFQHDGTAIPNWVSKMWDLSDDFLEGNTRKDPQSKVKIIFNEKEYDGWINLRIKGRKTPQFRMFYSRDLTFELKDAFVMSFARDIEDRLRKSKNKKREKTEEESIENEIPFWDFLDIEYDKNTKKFYFKAYYTQKPTFEELFKRLIESPVFHKIDDELKEKPPFRIYKTKWKPRNDLEYELGANNVLYTLIDTKNKLLYIGEAASLIDRLRQDHPSIPNWDFFRYNVLPNEIAEHRKSFERMAIRDLSSLLMSKDDSDVIKISEYRLTNDKIDLT